MSSQHPPEIHKYKTVTVFARDEEEAKVIALNSSKGFPVADLDEWDLPFICVKRS